MKALPKDKKTDLCITEVARGNYGIHLNFKGYHGSPQIGKSLIEKVGFPKIGDLVTVIITNGYNGCYISEYKPIKNPK